MSPLAPKSLVVFAPSYAIAVDCLRVDHGIDPRHPALRFVRRMDELYSLRRPVPVMVVDPFAKHSLKDDGQICWLRKMDIIRDWSEDEIEAVSL